VIEYGNITIGPNTTVVLDGSRSYDPDINGISSGSFMY